MALLIFEISASIALQELTHHYDYTLWLLGSLSALNHDRRVEDVVLQRVRLMILRIANLTQWSVKMKEGSSRK